MSVENRLAAEQLAALQPGDPVVIESAVANSARARHTTGTVARVTASRVVVSVRSRYGATYTEEYGLRDGVRVGGRVRAELVDAGSVEHPHPEGRRRLQRVDAAYREWTRDRGDLDRLRRLREVADELLHEAAAGTR